ncbi:GGDEF domain-containing protein [Nocardia suismassiliense]|uniref:GGDEF domain-containing protein n=1 Tax=Nocardia suismassiliense TaxID=2077092 RepID=UPI001F432E54|nr:GGDEF domain-containing protein [Nocardia suismassiliense]
MGAVMLVTGGGDVTILHGPRVLAAHVSWSLLSIAALVILMVIGVPAHTGHGTVDPGLAAGIVLSNVIVTCVVLPTVQLCHWLLRLDGLSDPLTALLNRRGLDSHLARFAGHRVHGDVYVVALDLNRFKSVNDTFGHAFGDQVLVRTAECLRTAAPACATVARTGGEEFAIVGYLQGETIGVVAERLRSAIESMAGLPIVITAGVGAAVCESAENIAPQTESRHYSLFYGADSAMYQAKQLGGNTVVIAGNTATT